MMGMSPASMGLNNSPAARQPDKYEYSWSWDLSKQAEVYWNPGSDVGSMPWIEGGQGGDAVFVNAIPSSAHTGGWEVKRKPSGYVTAKDATVGFAPTTGEVGISNAACSGDYGYSIGRVPAKALESGVGGGAVQTPNGNGGNRYLSIVLTFLPGYDHGNARKIKMGAANYCLYERPQYINGVPHWIWDGTVTDHNATTPGVLSAQSVAAGRSGHGTNMITDSDIGKITTLTFDMNTADEFKAGSDIDELKYYDEASIQNSNVGFVMHGFIIGCTVPHIRSLPIRIQEGGEGRHSLKAFGPGS
jgi:hypothetical protein